MAKHLHAYALLVFIFLIGSSSVHAQAPAISSFTPANGPVGTLVTINGSNLSNPSLIQIGGVNAIPISNTGTKLVAMVMPGAVTGAVSVSTSGGSAVDTGSYTITSSAVIDAQQGPKLVGTSVVGNIILQGRSVALSSDGNTAIVGGPADNDFLGAVWVFVRDVNGVWAQQGGKLIANDNGENANFGSSVAISADGNTAVVGAPNALGGLGAAWVFVRDGKGVWAQQGGNLRGTGEYGFEIYQGSSVAISADGNTVISGGYADSVFFGAAWVFKRGTNSLWVQQGNKLIVNDNAGPAEVGQSVALSADGRTAVLGGQQDSAGIGAVWIFNQDSLGIWKQKGHKLIGRGALGNAYQGCSVAVNANGSAIIVGGDSDNHQHGAAWIFVKQDTTWVQQGGKLTGMDATDSAIIGTSVAMAADGKTVAFGGNGDNHATGAFWIYTVNSANMWVQQGKKFVGKGVFDFASQGQSVAISPDGSTVITGGAVDGSYKGAVWVFTHVPVPVITSFAPQKGSVGTLINIKGSHLTYPAYFTVNGITTLAISANAMGSQATVMVMPGSTSGPLLGVAQSGASPSTNIFTVLPLTVPDKQQGGKLVAADYSVSSRSGQGSSVAISADGNTAIVGAPSDSSSTGAVWIYTRRNGIWSQTGSKLIVTGANPDYYAEIEGSSVAISADGNTAVVGAQGDYDLKGAAYVFVRASDSTWVQQGHKLIGWGFGEGPTQQGRSAAISGDGNTIVIGANGDKSLGGAAIVYTRNTSGVWSQQDVGLAGVGGVGLAEEGYSVAISADGGTIILGDPTAGYDVGTAWVFARGTDRAWVQQSMLQINGKGGITPPSTGTSVALSADGNTAIVGAPTDNNGGGSAYVFVRNAGGTWVQQGNKLTGTGATGLAYQGTSVALNAAGNVAVIGGDADSVGLGALWVFTRSDNGVWSQHGTKLVGTGYAYTPYVPYDGVLQGYATAISADGHTIIEGGRFDKNEVGAAWVFTDSNANALPVNLTNFTAFQIGKGVQTAWTGYDEINLASYTVERSGDSYQFVAICNVAAKNNGSADNDYMFFDANPLTGDNFYRVKAISKDGTFQYSKIAKVNIGDGKTGLFVCPNPVVNKTIQLQLNSVAGGTYTISVYNTVGQKVYSGSYKHAGGNATVPVSVKGAAAGIYHVEVLGSKNKYISEVVVR